MLTEREIEQLRQYLLPMTNAHNKLCDQAKSAIALERRVTRADSLLERASHVLPNNGDLCLGIKGYLKDATLA